MLCGADFASFKNAEILAIMLLRLTYPCRTASGQLTRRAWLACGAAPLLAGGFVHPTRAVASSARGAGRSTAKSVLFIVANGGQSQLDTWDPKPNAPAEIRGEFSSIATALPGIRFCEHLPRMAQLADRLTVVRSMSHEDLDHGSALYLTLTGQYFPRLSSNPLPSPLDRPTLGSLVKLVGPKDRFLHPAIHVNGPAQIPINIGAGQNAGLLGPEMDPLLLGDVTAMKSPLPELDPLPEVPGIRLDRRLSLRQQLDQARQEFDGRAALRYDEQFRRAGDMLDDPRVRSAFDLEAESDRMKAAYGLDRSGQACLLARRLVEAGVPWITVFWNHTGRGQDLEPETTTEYGWDTHNDIFDALKNRLLPRFDQSMATLLTDLSERGLLDQTLVVIAGEFGRAPIVALEKNFAGSSPGRKHWGACYSVVCAGGGTRPGQVIGVSDSRGAYPVSEAYGPWDLAATMLSAIGIDPEQRFLDPLGRTHPLVEGRVMHTLYS